MNMHQLDSLALSSIPTEEQVNEVTKRSAPLHETAILAFITAGAAIFTVENLNSGNRYTYKVSAPSKTTPRGGKVKDRDANVRFVSVLSGQCNENDYQFVGTIFLDSMMYHHSKKHHLPRKASIVFRSLFNDYLSTGKLPKGIAIHHEGACGRCGRRLTVPESIKTGFGPECINKV